MRLHVWLVVCRSSVSSVRPSVHQAIACYTPKFHWSAFEGNLMQTLSMGLHLGICGDDEKTAKKQIILKYLNTHRKVRVCEHPLLPFPVTMID